jgi:hypothetical protein
VHASIEAEDVWVRFFIACLEGAELIRGRRSTRDDTAAPKPTPAADTVE